jgi:hypothetical protein
VTKHALPVNHDVNHNYVDSYNSYIFLCLNSQPVNHDLQLFYTTVQYIIEHNNKNVDIKFSEHGTFLEYDIWHYSLSSEWWPSEWWLSEWLLLNVKWAMFQLSHPGQVIFPWYDDDVCFVLDQNVWLDSKNASMNTKGLNCIRGIRLACLPLVR